MRNSSCCSEILRLIEAHLNHYQLHLIGQKQTGMSMYPSKPANWIEQSATTSLTTQNPKSGYIVGGTYDYSRMMQEESMLNINDHSGGMAPSLSQAVQEFIIRHKAEHPILVDLEQEIVEQRIGSPVVSLAPMDEYEEDVYNGVSVRQRVKKRLAKKRLQVGVKTYVGIAICPSISTRLGMVVYNQVDDTLECATYDFWLAIARIDKMRKVFNGLEVQVYATCEEHPTKGAGGGEQRQSQYERDIELLAEHCTSVGFTCTIVPPMKRRWSDREFRLHTKANTRKVPQSICDAARAIWWRWL